MRLLDLEQVIDSLNLQESTVTGKKPLADIKYLLAAINPLTSRVHMREDLMNMSLEAYKWDVIGRSIFKTGTYDPFLSQWLVDRFRGKGGNFIDIGANLGYFSCLLGVLAGPNGCVISVEPEPANLALLRANVAANDPAGIIKIFPVALGAAEGTATLNLYKSSNRGRHSMVAAGSGRKIEVPVKRLDTLATEILRESAIVDFLKIDVEGYEPYVVQGANETMNRVQCMVMEYAPYILKHAGADIRAFLQGLAKNFSKIYSIEQNSLQPITIEKILERQDAVDLLFEK